MRVKLICWGCGEVGEFFRQGPKLPGFIEFYREHYKCPPPEETK